MKRGLAGFWYRFKNWFRTKPGPGEPLRFLCRSEEELRRVTTWVCHVHPHIYSSGSVIRIIYVASTRRSRGHATLLPLGEFAHNMPYTELIHILKTCRTVFECNKFTGTEWVNGSSEERAMLAMRLEGGPIGVSIAGIYEQPIHLDITSNAPSAHQRAEALLSLSEWLDGKVSEEEKRELLGLCD